MSHFSQEIITVVGRCAAPLPARSAVGAPGGGLPGWSPADRAIPESTGGGLPFGLPAAPDFSLLFCPPSPKGKDRPPAPFPSGEGGDYKFILPGASPPAPLHLTACDTYSPCHAGARRGACLPCRLSALPLACFFAPIPPTPFPSGEGGAQGYFMQGAPPLASPGTKPTVRRQSDRKQFPMSSAGSQGEGGPGERNFGV